MNVRSVVVRGAVASPRVVVPVLLASALLLVPSGPADGATQPSTLAGTTATTPTITPVPSATPGPSPSPVNPVAPKVTTGTAELIAGSAATLTATITAGGAAATYRFQYGTTAAYGLTTPEAALPATATATTVKVSLAGLTAGTTYHFRVVATNAAGSVQGADRSFATVAAAKLATVSTQSASKVSATQAQLNARVNPQGQPTAVRFEWGLTTAYGNATADVAAGSGRGTLSRSMMVSGLQAGTVFHYRAVATNASGVVVGRDRTVQTSRGLTGVSAVLSAPVMPWNGSLGVSGQVSGTAPAGVKVELLRQDAPFTGPYRHLASSTTNLTGAYAFRLTRVFSSARVRVRVVGAPTVASPELMVASGVLVRLQVGVRKAATTRVRGTVYPATSMARAVLQRQTPSGRWVKVRRLRLAARPGGRMAFRTVVKRLGRDAYYRVAVAPNDGGQHVATDSTVVMIAARRARAQ